MNKRIRKKKWKQKRDARRKYIKSIRGKVSGDTYAYALMVYAIRYGSDDFLKEYDTPYVDVFFKKTFEYLRARRRAPFIF